MRHKTLGSVVACLFCLLIAGLLRAQDPDSEDDYTRRRIISAPAPTLGQRFEQFREGLLGDSRQRSRQPDPHPAKSNKSQPTQRAKAAEESTSEADAGDEPQRDDKKKPRQGQPAPTETQQSGRKTTKPEFQTARRAQPPAATPAAPEPQPEPKVQAEPQRQPQADRPPQPQTQTAHRGEAIPATMKPLENGHLPTLQEKLAAARQAAPQKSIVPKDDVPTEGPSSRVARVERREPGAEVQLPEHSIKRPASDNLLFAGQSAVLSVEAAGPRKVMIGKEATFEVKIRNAGDAAANNVLVTVNIPAFAELAGSQASMGTIHATMEGEHREPMEWKIGRLEAHSREVLTLRLVPRKSVPLDLAVQWSCSPDVTQTLVEVQEPKLMMALSGPEEILYGKSKIYKLTISNPGNGDAENVLVTLQPVGKTAEAAASHRLGTIRAGESKAIEVELTARQAGVLTIRAQAFADGGLRSEAAEQVLVRRATIKIDAEAPKVKYAGTTSTYRIRVANSGNATAQNVQLSALLPPDAKFVSGDGGARPEMEHGKVNWNAGTLQPGAERIFEMQCVLQSPGENRLQFSAIAEDDISGAASAMTRVEAMADLKLEVRDPQGPIPVGEETVYEVVIRNRGTKSADGIELVVFFSEGLEATAVQGGAHEIGNGEVVFKPISLQAGRETVLRVHARADRGGNHVFRAEVVCQSLETKLAAEETTRFYGEEPTAQEDASAKTPRRRAFEPQEESPAEEEHP